jgi:hypothetical protein
MITKKAILMILLLISFSNILLCQSHGQIDFARKLYCKLVFDEIDIRNANKELIDKEGLFNIFYSRDTAINCFGDLIDRFHDNVYYDPQLLIFSTEFVFDTLTNQQNPQLINLVRVNIDDAGNYIGKTFIFSFDRDLIKDFKETKNNSINDKRLLNDNDEYWVIQKIENRDKSIFIDDCHKQYRLSFTTNQIFNQKFQKSKIKCMTTIDLNKISEEKKMSYWGNKVYHDISINKGQWKTKNNKLILINENRDIIKEISYEFHNNTLILYYGDKYKIELEKIKPMKRKTR